MATLLHRPRHRSDGHEPAAHVADAAGFGDALSASRGVAGLACALGAVGTAANAALAAMYALEIGKIAPEAMVYGPLNDIGGAAWNLLTIPLVVSFGRQALPERGGGVLYGATLVASVAAACSSAALVVGVLPFPASTAVTVGAAIVQSGWLFAVGSSLRHQPRWARLGRQARAIAGSFWAGMGIAALSLPLRWGSPAQIAVIAVGAVPTLLAWVAWPLWMIALGRHLARLSGSTTGPIGAAAH